MNNSRLCRNLASEVQDAIAKASSNILDRGNPNRSSEFVKLNNFATGESVPHASSEAFQPTSKETTK